jgi:hypothetical protein
MSDTTAKREVKFASKNPFLREKSINEKDRQFEKGPEKVNSCASIIWPRKAWHNMRG